VLFKVTSVIKSCTDRQVTSGWRP